MDAEGAWRLELRFSWRGFGRAIFYLTEERTMNFYKDLYYKLFAVMADAVESLENNEPLAAKKVLIAAMREAEEIIVSTESE